MKLKRRRVLRGALVGVAGVAGCAATDGERREGSTSTPTATPGAVDASIEERVKRCERDYVDTRLFAGGDESIVDRSGPVVVESEARADGAYVEVETHVGTVRSVEGEPDEHADYVVTAAYLVTAEEVYRTEEFDVDGGPRDGTTVDC